MRTTRAPEPAALPIASATADGTQTPNRCAAARNERSNASAATWARISSPSKSSRSTLAGGRPRERSNLTMERA